MNTLKSNNLLNTLSAIVLTLIVGTSAVFSAGFQGGPQRLIVQPGDQLAVSVKGSDYLYPGSKASVFTSSGRGAAQDGELTTEELSRGTAVLVTDDGLAQVASYYQDKFAVEFTRANVRDMDSWTTVVRRPDYQARITIGTKKDGGETYIALRPQKFGR